MKSQVLPLKLVASEDSFLFPLGEHFILVVIFSCSHGSAMVLEVIAHAK